MLEKIDLNNLDKSDWETYRFEEIAEKISKTIKPEEAEVDIYVGLEHLDAEDIHIRRRGVPSDVKGGKLRCAPGDIIFGKRRAYQRKAAIVDFEGICSAHAFVFRAKPEVIHPKLFPFFLHSDQFMHRMIDISVGGLSPTINWGDLKHQEFLLPPKDQHAQLAELLWSIEDYYEIRKKIFAKYEEVLQSFLKENIFEKNYDQIKLKNIYKIRRGASPRPIKDPKYFSESGRGWIRISDVSKSFKYLKSTEQKLSDLGVQKSVEVDENDIIMSICATIGLPMIIKSKSCIHDGFVLFQPKDDSILPEFLYYLLKYKEKYFQSKRQMGTQGNLNTTIVGNTKIPKIPKEVQTTLLRKINAIEDSFFNLNNGLKRIENLKKVLVINIF